MSTGSPGRTHIGYTPADTLIANHPIDSNGDRPGEAIRSSFTKLEATCIPCDESDRPQSLTIASCDLAITRAA